MQVGGDCGGLRGALLHLHRREGGCQLRGQRCYLAGAGLQGHGQDGELLVEQGAGGGDLGDGGCRINNRLYQ